MGGVERGVEAVETERGRRIAVAHAPGYLLSQPQSGMHGNGDGNEARACNRLIEQWFDGSIDGHRRITSLPQQRQQRGKLERLVAQFIARDEQDIARASHFLREGPPPPLRLGPAPATASSGIQPSGICASSPKKNSSICSRRILRASGSARFRP